MPRRLARRSPRYAAKAAAVALDRGGGPSTRSPRLGTTAWQANPPPPSYALGGYGGQAVSGRATQCRTRRGPRRGCPLGATQSRRGLPPETVPQTEGVRLGGSGGRPAGKRDRRSPRAAHPPLQRGLGGPVEAAERGNRRRAAKPRVLLSRIAIRLAGVLDLIDG
jgi:hypothetical protein